MLKIYSPLCHPCSEGWGSLWNIVGLMSGFATAIQKCGLQNSFYQQEPLLTLSPFCEQKSSLGAEPKLFNDMYYA